MSLYTFPLDDHLVIFRPMDKRLFILNQTASLIWRITASGLTTDEIIELLASHFQVTIEDITRDVHTTLDLWTKHGLYPAQSEKGEQAHSAKLSPNNAITKLWLPKGDQVTLQLDFQFGQSTFTLLDYTPDLANHFQPLLASLPVAEQKKTKNLIELYNDGNEYVTSCNQVELERTTDDLITVGRVIQTIIEHGYPQTIWMAFIHGSAGALDGRGIVFPGIGGSGKSTLMAALAKCDWVYWCDDTVPLDIDGNAGAVPLSHCIKSGSWDVLTQYYPDLKTLEVHHRGDKNVRYLPLNPEQTNFTTTLPVHTLVFPTYSPGSPQTLQPLSPVESLRLLIEAQSWISHDPTYAGELVRWISVIPAYSLNYYSLDWAVEELNHLVRTNR